MDVGVPREIKDHEYRVALTPDGVRELTAAGHRVLVESGAGAGSTIPDEAYQRAGATVVDTAEEVWGRAELLLKVKEPLEAEYRHLRGGQVLFTYLHLAASRPLTQALCAAGVTAVAYETVELPGGLLPLLAPMSEIAGRMAPQVAAHLLEREQGGRGVLMGGASGVRPARVVVLGAGMAGTNAAVIAAGMDAEVVLIDKRVAALRHADADRRGRVVTVMSSRQAIEEQVRDADVVIGTVLVPGARTPKLITAEDVARMREGAVLIDISVDQGGCCETSRPTTFSDPTYLVDGVVHYCVGNMPGAVPNTSTYALTNVTLPYVLQIAAAGLEQAAAEDPALAKGINVYEGTLVSQPVAEAHGLDAEPLHKVLPTLPHPDPEVAAG
jgi:alanine dehydrogenase